MTMKMIRNDFVLDRGKGIRLSNFGTGLSFVGARSFTFLYLHDYSLQVRALTRR